MHRRGYLGSVGALGIATLAGCGEPLEEPTPGPTDTPTATPTDHETPTGEAVFEFTAVEPVEETYAIDEEFLVAAWVRNAGDGPGVQTIELRMRETTLNEMSIDLEPGQETRVAFTADASVFEPGDWAFTFRSADDEIAGSFTIPEPDIEEPDSYAFSGSGQAVGDGLEIAGGLTVVEATHDGRSNFQVKLVDDGEHDDLFVNVIGAFDGAQAALVDAGSYMLDVNADGEWTIDVHQPRAETGDRLPQSIAGTGPDVIGPIEFDGTHVATGSHDGESNFQVLVYPDEGRYGELVFNEIGTFEGETTFRHTGAGWVDVHADGDWSVDLE